MTVVVSGATGFLGRRLVEVLDASGEELVLHRRTPTGDARHREVSGSGADLARAAVETSADVVFHLATHFLKSHVPSDIHPLLAANVEFATELYEGLAGSGIRVVAAMSFFQFEQGAPAPLSLYAATKQAAYEIGEYYRRGGLDLRHVVLYDTYGPGDTRDKLVPLLLESARTGAAVTLGAPDQPINLVYVDDVVEGLLAASQDAAPALVTVRADEPVAVAQLVEAVRRATGAELPAAFATGATPSSRPLVAGDWPAPPGWRPKVGLDEGLRRAWEDSAG